VHQAELFQFTTDLEVFGHGFSVAGCVLLHFLGQRHAYELTDFSYQVLRMRRYEESLPRAVHEQRFAQVEEDELYWVDVFVQGALEQRDVHVGVFALLDALVPRDPAKAAVGRAGVRSGGKVRAPLRYDPPPFFAD
jgi:hypothetical protein